MNTDIKKHIATILLNHDQDYHHMPTNCGVDDCINPDFYYKMAEGVLKFLGEREKHYEQILSDVTEEIKEIVNLSKYLEEIFGKKLNEGEIYQIHRIWEFADAAEQIASERPALEESSQDFMVVSYEDYQTMVQAIEYAFEEKEGWRKKVAKAVRLMPSVISDEENIDEKPSF
jgi:hypothetical protein